MSEDILINITPQETRVALILQGAVQELNALQARWQRAPQAQWPLHRHRLEGLAGRLQALDP